MKKLVSKTLLFITIFVFLTASVSIGQINANKQRNVVWLHGLDGDAGSWEHYEQIFSMEREIKSLRKSYDTDNGVQAATVNVMNIIDLNLKTDAFNNRNMGIGHSMGGIVSRNLDRITASGQKRFGGFITVASPNYGSKMANSVLNGSVERAVTNAVTQLTAGPTAEFSSATWTIPIPSALLQTASMLFGGAANPQNIANLVNRYLDYQNIIGNPITNNDLKVGSAILGDINDFATNIPRISMWANESSPVHWRVIGSSIYSMNGQEPLDQPLVDVMVAVNSVYYSRYLTHNAFSIANSIFGIFGPASWHMSTISYWMGQQWKKGSTWLNGSESLWTTLTGSYKLVPYTYTVWVLECENGPINPPQDWYPDPDYGDNGGENCVWVEKTYTHYVVVRSPSDGLVSKDTQIISDLPPQNVYEIKNANHISVRNMSYKGQNGDNTYKEFDKIWKRTYPDFFNTLEK